MGQADTGKFVKRSAPRGILKHDPTFNGRRYLDMQDDWFANYVDKQRDIGERAEAGADVKAEQEALDAKYRSGKGSKLDGPQGHQWGLPSSSGPRRLPYRARAWSGDRAMRCSAGWRAARACSRR